MTLEANSISSAKLISGSSDAAKSVSTESHEQGPHGIVGGVEDMLYAAAYSAVAQPLVGVAQLVTGGKVDSIPGLSAPTDNSLWTKAGSLVGNVADFMLLSKTLGRVAPGVFGAESTISPLLRGGLTGGIYSMMMPTDSTGNFFLNKARSTVIGAGTFAAMDGLANPLASTFGRSLTGDIASGALSGTAGGVAGAGLTDLLYWKKPSTSDLSNIAYYGVFGGVMGAASHLPFFRASSTESQQADNVSKPQSTTGDRSASEQAAGTDSQAIQTRVVTDNQTSSTQANDSPASAGEVTSPKDSIVWTAKTLDSPDAIKQYFDQQAGKPEADGGGLFHFQKGYYEVKMTHPLDRETLLTTSENHMIVGEDLPLEHLPAVDRTAVFTTEQGRAQVTSELTMADGTVIPEGTELPNGVRVSADNVSDPQGAEFARKLNGNVELTVAQGSVKLSTGQVITSGKAHGEVTIDGGQVANPGEHIVLRQSTDDAGNPRIDTYPVNAKNFKKWVPVSGKPGYYAPDLSTAVPVDMVPIQPGDAIRFKTAWGDPATNNGPAFMAKYSDSDFNIITERDLRETYIGADAGSRARLDQIIAAANQGRSTPVPTAQGSIGADGKFHLS